VAQLALDADVLLGSGYAGTGPNDVSVFDVVFTAPLAAVSTRRG
jgi:hypothetical protein